MYYDFVDIGTCDFDTSAESALPDQKVLLVKPIKFYLDRITNGNNIIKANLAVGKTKGFIKVNFVPEWVLQKFNLPWWLKGCSSVGDYHKSVVKFFTENNIPLSLIETQQVEILTFKELCLRYNISSINNLKIDTEGHEQYILPNVLDMIRKGFHINILKYENQESLGNKVFVDYLTEELVKVGYEIIDINQTDTTLKKSTIN
jgi:FkbM family methyltransferase